MLATDIPLRSNGQGSINRVDASWFNIIRTFLIDAFPGTVGETRINLDNNATEIIPSLIFDSSEIIMARFRVTSIRKTDAPSELRTYSEIVATYKTNGGWALETEHLRDNPQTSYTIDSSTGQVSYTTSNLAGANYFGKATWKVLDTTTLEV